MKYVPVATCSTRIADALLRSGDMKINGLLLQMVTQQRTFEG